jgi:hypothetical protein
MINIEIISEEVYNNRPLLPLEDKTKWIEALKSGKYKKGKGVLNKRNNEYCCLGILVEIENLSKKEYNGIIEYGDNRENIFLPKDSKSYNILGGVGYFKGFTINYCSNLAAINDSTETFDEVIEIIEKYF